MRKTAGLGAVLLVATGCSSAGHFPAPAARVAWPAPPEAARIELAFQFASPPDLGIGRGALRSIADAITGAPDLKLRRPYAVATFGDGPDSGPARIAVTDTEAKTVHVFDVERGTHLLIGEVGDEGPLETPVGVAWDGFGRLYVVDSTRKVLVRFAADGELDRVLARNFERPAGLAVDVARGVVYVADARAHVVRRLDYEGRELSPVARSFECPTHLSVDREGRLLVSDSLAFQVLVISREGELLATLGRAGDSGGDLARPKGVATDGDGHVYVADALFDNVQIFDLEGRLLLSFGSAGGDPGELALPAGLAIDQHDLIFVADAWNGRVQAFRYLRERGP